MGDNTRNSGLHGFIIDCRTDDLEGAARFWSEALGLKLDPAADVSDPGYRHLAAGPGGLGIEIQKVEHESRVHLDLQAEDRGGGGQAPGGAGRRRFPAGQGLGGHGSPDRPPILRRPGAGPQAAGIGAPPFLPPTPRRC